MARMSKFDMTWQDEDNTILNIQTCIQTRYIMIDDIITIQQYRNLIPHLILAKARIGQGPVKGWGKVWAKSYGIHITYCDMTRFIVISSARGINLSCLPTNNNTGQDIRAW